MIRLCSILVFFILEITFVFSQEYVAESGLLKRAEENYKLVFTKSDLAFQRSINILKEAQKANNLEAELCAISTQCIYYESKNNFEELLTTAKLLFRKAEEYQNPVYQASAKIDLFNAYAFNELYDKAFEELQKGKKIISKVDDDNFRTILTRVNLLVAFSNYYLLKKDYQNQLKYIELSAPEYEKFPDEKYKERFRYIDYSNRSRVFIDLKRADSAEYYAKLSNLKESGYGRNDIQFSNFLVLGRVANEKGNYKDAVLYLNEAEKVKGYKNHLNLLTLYDNTIKAYTMLNENDKVTEYKEKRDSLKLNISENQNKSLLNLLDEKGTEAGNQYTYVLVVFLMAMAILVIYFIRKNRILVRQEKFSREYLKRIDETKDIKDYSRLMEMLRQNDPAFMHYFNESFPHFTLKLRELNPKIIQSDIEFCALLKLNIPSNDIARYKYITLKSVQNRKYFIRKKLGIPTGVDIYNWFSSV